MDRLFERAFNKVHAESTKKLTDQEKKQQQAEAPVEEDAPCAIKRILDCWKNKEYFK